MSPASASNWRVTQHVLRSVMQMDAARFVIWVSPFWGPVADNGRTFEQINLYEATMKRIETIVSLPAFIDELFPQDIASMVALRRFAAVSFIEQNVLKVLAWSKPVYPAQRLGVASKRPSLFGNRSIFGVAGGATKYAMNLTNTTILITGGGSGGPK